MKAKLLMVYLVLMIVTPLGSMYLNEQAAKEARDLVSSIPATKSVKVVDKIYVSGRLDGNEHEVKSFGAILIKSNKSQKALQNYYGKNKRIYVKKQESPVIKQITRKKVKFKKYEQSDDMYIVYCWGCPEYKVARKLDIRAWTPNPSTIKKLTSVQ
ncbi:MAG: hypothetical protein K6G88_13505 [Lachnospiraceae bacterium]|nr:hypothetical protein [Lachnospiraceae bacterium]